jgi:hypothetical protein
MRRRDVQSASARRTLLMRARPEPGIVWRTRRAHARTCVHVYVCACLSCVQHAAKACKTPAARWSASMERDVIVSSRSFFR